MLDSTGGKEWTEAGFGGWRMPFLLGWAATGAPRGMFTGVFYGVGARINEHGILKENEIEVLHSSFDCRDLFLWEVWPGVGSPTGRW